MVRTLRIIFHLSTFTSSFLSAHTYNFHHLLQMSESEATSTSSLLNHYPLEQRGSLGLQKELNEMSGMTRHPINPDTAVSEEAARNIEKIEDAMKSSSSSLHLYMDPTWSNEQYYRGAPEDIAGR